MRQTSARSSPLSMFLLVAAVLALGAAATGGGLWYSGKLDQWFRSGPMAYVPAEGAIAVHLSVKEIPAYTKITREHLFDAKGSAAVSYLNGEEVARRQFMTDPNKILGRVVAHEFKVGYAFKESDFLPRDTREGIVGGIPPGKSAFVLETVKVHGIHALKIGDHFDLLSSVVVEHVNPQGKPPPVAEPKKQAIVKALVQNGVVVKAAAARSPIQGAPAKKNDKPVEEIVIAVDPDEIASLTAALALGADIMTAYRSGRPDDAQHRKDITPGTPPPMRPTTIEVIQGNHREVVSFYPKTADPPVSPAKSDHP